MPINVSAVNKAVHTFFIKNPTIHLVPAKHLMPEFIAAGIYNRNDKDGLQIRNDLRELQRTKSLHLIPSLVTLKKQKNTNWFFRRTSQGQVEIPLKSWGKYCDDMMNLLCNKEAHSFFDLRGKLSTEGGIYIITHYPINGKEKPLYIGRTKNLRQRVYTNHMMGALSNARLKKYLMNEFKWDKTSKIHRQKAKDYIIENCQVRWITNAEIQERNPFPDEDLHRIRGALESYFTGILFPKYGIYEEH